MAVNTYLYRGLGDESTDTQLKAYKREVKYLKEEIEKRDLEIKEISEDRYRLSARVSNELEPRLKNEAISYDSWIENRSNPCTDRSGQPNCFAYCENFTDEPESTCMLKVGNASKEDIFKWYEYEESEIAATTIISNDWISDYLPWLRAKETKAEQSHMYIIKEILKGQTTKGEPT